MSYNGSGLYITPAGQPVATGTVIQSATFNTLVTDIGNTFNNVLPRDGQASMSGQLKIMDGTNVIPGIAFNSEASSGMYRPASGVVALVASGIESLRFNNGGRVMIGTTSDDGINKLQVNGLVGISGAATITSTLNVTGTSTLTTLNTSGPTSLGSTLAVTGNTTAGGALGVTGTTTLSGLVGIGITPPDSTYKLRVVGVSRFGDSGTGTDYFDVGSTNNVSVRLQALGSSNVASLGTTSNNALTLFTNSAEALRIDPTGKLLVARTTDDGTGAKVQVFGNASVSGQLNLGAQQSVLASSATVARTYTLPDKSGTLAMVADLAGATGSLMRSVRTSNTTLTQSDRSTLVDITSGTFTQTFTAAATLGAGWYFWIRNSGTGEVTLDPNGSELIDGLTSYVMYPGEARLIQCDGTQFTSVVLVGFYREYQSSATWTKPPGYASFELDIVSGGTSGCVGPGGGGGGRYKGRVYAAALAATVTVTVGAGGVWSSGAVCVQGGTSTFGPVSVYGGYQQSSGYSSDGGSVFSVGSPGLGINGQYWQGAGGSNGNQTSANGIWGGGSGGFASSASNLNQDGGGSIFGAGGGGGYNSGYGSYGAGGRSGFFSKGGGAAGSNSGNGANGAAATTTEMCGGGGGASSTTFGGNGGFPGGGGGGGALGGGSGASGVVRIRGIV